MGCLATLFCCSRSCDVSRQFSATEAAHYGVAPAGLITRRKAPSCRTNGQSGLFRHLPFFASLKLELSISSCMGLQFKCTSPVENNRLNALYSRPCLFTGTNHRWFKSRTCIRWESAPAGWSSKLQQSGANPWYELWCFPQTECCKLLCWSKEIPNILDF